MSEILGYISFIFIGGILSFLGAGGSVLSVPILLYIFKLPVLTVTTYSLFIVGFSSLLGVIQNRKSLFDNYYWLYCIPSITGVFLTRFFLLPFLQTVFPINKIETFLIASLLIFMSISSYAMLVSEDRQKAKNEIRGFANTPLTVSIIFICIGVIVGLLGIGGGFIIVPVLTLLGIKIKKAVNVSFFIMMMNALIALIFSPIHLGWSDYVFLTGLTSMAFLGVLIGFSCQQFINESVLRKTFGVILFFVACFMAVQSFLIH